MNAPLSLFPELPSVHLNDHTGKIYTFSHEVADFFCKKHKHIIGNIRSILKKNPEFAAHFRAAKYERWGRKEPCFRISEEGFVFLITKFTGDKFNDLIMAYAERFSYMARCVPIHQHSKQIEQKMCSAIEVQRATHDKGTEAHHYINENTLCDLVLLGCTPKKYKEKLGVPDNTPIASILSPEQLTQLDSIRTEKPPAYRGRFVVRR